MKLPIAILILTIAGCASTSTQSPQDYIGFDPAYAHIPACYEVNLVALKSAKSGPRYATECNAR